ncbi:hypothetical protein PNH38_10875 [Anoxybacillus rupiensis]|uniref:Uncharacterized protein n=1 Tax=Anoxybacteroides rupiense TaxID=311460 RepID=A0ABT5W4Z9_9BACL|nr:hypothetical protein [Anoxybacillus rupiensis]
MLYRRSMILALDLSVKDQDPTRRSSRWLMQKPNGMFSTVGDKPRTCLRHAPAAKNRTTVIPAHRNGKYWHIKLYPYHTTNL